MLAVNDDDGVCKRVPVAVAQLDTEVSAVPLAAPLLVVSLEMIAVVDAVAALLTSEEFEMRGEPDLENEGFALIDSKTEGEGSRVDRSDPVEEPAHESDFIVDSLGVALDDAGGEPETEFVEPVGDVDAEVAALADATFDAVLRGDSVAFSVGTE